MPFVPTVNTLRADLHYLWDSQQCSNSLYFQGSASPDIALATELGEALISWWETEYAPNVAETVSLQEVVLTDLTNETSFSIAVTTGLPISGTVASPSLPNNVSLCISFRTAQRGRSSRGRNYVVGMCESQAVASEATEGFIGVMLDAYEQLIGAGTFVAGLQWVVVSTISNGDPRSSGLAQPVTSVIVTDPVIDSQRRRLPGRGN